MDVQWHPRALAELNLAAEYYESKRPGLGDAFLDEVEASIERIHSFPTAWPKITDRSRRVRTRRFPYGLVFQPHDNRITILAVMHLRRRPEYWRDREE